MITCSPPTYSPYRDTLTVNLPDCIVAVRRLEVRWFKGSYLESKPPPQPRPVRTAHPACHGVLVDDWIHVEAAHSRCRVASLRLRELTACSSSFVLLFAAFFFSFFLFFHAHGHVRRVVVWIVKRDRGEDPEWQRKRGKVLTLSEVNDALLRSKYNIS